MKSHSRSFGLDVVRAVAISLVLISHFVKPLEIFGFWGVELFFGLSGFLIGQILWRNFSRVENWTPRHMLNFWSRRWWRTLPNYYLFFAVWLLYFYLDRGTLPETWLLLKSLWFGQDFLSRTWGFYSVSWSLCIEEWFYLSFPCLLFLVSRSKLQPKLAFGLTLVFFFLIIGSIRATLAHSASYGDIRTITMARLDAIACGVAMAYMTSLITLKASAKWAFFVAGTALLLSPIVVAKMTHTPYKVLEHNQFLLLLVPLGASFILPLVGPMPAPQGIFAFIGTVVEKMSLWSYSIYLSHVPILFGVYYLMSGVREHSVGNLASKVIGLVVTIAISALVFQYFELPITRKRPAEIKPVAVKNDGGRGANPIAPTPGDLELKTEKGSAPHPASAD